MFSDDNADKVLSALATASSARESIGRRQVATQAVCADLGLSEREWKQALEDLERAGDIRRVHLDLGCVYVTYTGRVRAERLAQARERQESNARQIDSVDISTIVGGA